MSPHSPNWKQELVLELGMGQSAIPIKLVDSPTALEEMVVELQEATTLGLDTEWRPTGRDQR